MDKDLCHMKLRSYELAMEQFVDQYFSTERCIWKWGLCTFCYWQGEQEEHELESKDIKRKKI